MPGPYKYPDDLNDGMMGDKLLKITIEEKLSAYCLVREGRTPAPPLVFIADGVIEHVDKFKDGLLTVIRDYIKRWEACEDFQAFQADPEDTP